MGYNNLIYISLVLATIDHNANPDTEGPNAATFPVLCIEEPEAHLHPALQYKFLKYLKDRITAKPKVPAQRTRQIFITTHSTHITSASGLDHLICFATTGEGVHCVAYPGRCFPDTKEGKESKAYVERYLDATKSNLLFAKGVLLVEGIAELILLPVLAEQLECSLTTNHVAIVSVGGLTFRHFLPLFGAGSANGAHALVCPIACLMDGDPTRKGKGDKGFKKCWPYQLDKDTTYEYRDTSPALASLTSLCANHTNILVRHTTKTLEYDLAYHNYTNTALVTPACTNANEVKELIKTPTTVPAVLADKLESAHADIDGITDKKLLERHRIASCYLQSLEDAKGEHAFALAQQFTNTSIVVPPPIEDVIRHATRCPKTSTKE